MNIGQFSDVYPPNIDGVGMVVNAYCETFNKNPADRCYYIAPKSPGKRQKENYPVINYNSLPIKNEAYRLGVPDIDPKLRKILDEVNLDIIHAHSPFTAGHYAAYFANKKNLPLISTFHSKYYDDFLAKTKSETLAKIGVRYIVNFYKKCDEVWAVNEATGQVLQDYGYKGVIQVMPNGTNLWYPSAADAQAARKTAGINTQNVFLFVGQHNFKKNIKNILKAIKLYSASHDDFTMVFVGQGPDAEAMKTLADEYGISDKTKFLGHIVDRKKLMGIYALANILIFPSLYDNAPMVVREAAAAGTPSILVENSCAAEGITDGYNGYLCKNSPESICKTIVKALPTAKITGLAARDTIPMAWDDVIAKARLRYENLVNEYKTGEKKREDDWFIKLFVNTED